MFERVWAGAGRPAHTGRENKAGGPCRLDVGDRVSSSGMDIEPCDRALNGSDIDPFSERLGGGGIRYNT